MNVMPDAQTFLYTGPTELCIGLIFNQLGAHHLCRKPAHNEYVCEPMYIYMPYRTQCFSQVIFFRVMLLTNSNGVILFDFSVCWLRILNFQFSLPLLPFVVHTETVFVLTPSLAKRWLLLQGTPLSQ